MPLFAVKTTASQERTCAKMITNRGLDDVYAALAPDEMTSYIIVEAEDIHTIERAIEEVPHANGVIQGQTSMAEVEGFLEPTSDVEGVSEGAIVELTGGPFSGDKAKVTEIDSSSEKVTVEMLDSTVPIPVEVGGDKIRVLDKDEWN